MHPLNGMRGKSVFIILATKDPWIRTAVHVFKLPDPVINNVVLFTCAVFYLLLQFVYPRKTIHSPMREAGKILALFWLASPSSSVGLSFSLPLKSTSSLEK